MEFTSTSTNALSTLLSMSNEELRNKLATQTLDSEFAEKWFIHFNTVSNEFKQEWDKKKFKWFFTKRRQKKLHSRIYRKYRNPMFDLIEETAEKILAEEFKSNEFITNMIDVKDVGKHETCF